MILTRNCTSRFRGGFTLVELMVAAALSITIMWILAESFKMGIDFARSARSTGDMMTQLNNAGQIFTRDLQAPHFYVSNPSINNSSGKLSSQRLDLLGSPGLGSTYVNGTLATAQGYTPPNGYFQIYSPPPPAAQIVTDITEGFQINTVTADTLQFTAYLPQGLPQNLFVATSPANSNNIYYSQAAEIGYFLGGPGGAGVQTGITPPTPGFVQQPLYNLYRRQRLVAVTSDYTQSLSASLTLNPANPQLFDPNASDVISVTPPQPPILPAIQVNTLPSFGTVFPGTLIPAARVPLTPLTTAGRVGDDIVLSNVLSFEVLVAWSPSQYITQAEAPAASPRSFLNAGNIQNSNYPFDNLPLFTALNTNAQYHYIFDTWHAITQPYPIKTNNPNANWNWNNFYLLNNLGPVPNFPPPGPRQIPHRANPNLIPLPIRVTGLQITIRIYDQKTRQARQNTWRVAM